MDNDIKNVNERRNENDRRDLSERRTGSERRRNADVRTPIIHITPTAIRMLVLIQRSGGEPDLAICRRLDWNSEAESLHSPQGSKELATALSALAAEERLAGANAEVLLSSELCVTRAVTGVNDDVQRETVTLRERSQLYLSLGPGTKLIASASTPLDARHAHAMLTVATEQTLRVISAAVEASGMELTAIRAAQVPLARTVHHASEEESATLVIGVDNGEVEVGLMRGGRLFLDYRPGGGVRADQLASLLGQHHTRLHRYCQRHHGLVGEDLTQVVISGGREEAALATASLQKLGHLNVETLDLDQDELPWEHRGEELVPEMAAAVGAAIAIVEGADDCGPNLMDQLVSTTRPPIAKMLLRKLSPLAATLLAVAVFGVLNWNGQRGVDAMQAELDLLAPKAARATQLRLELMAGHMELRQLGELETRLPQPVHSLLLRNLTQSIPPEIWLSGVRIDGNNVAAVAGASFAESSIYDLVGHLQHVPGVGEVALQGTGVGRTASRSATTFDIQLDLNLTDKGTTAEETL